MDRYYLKFCNKMAKAGCPRQIGEAPRQFAARCSRQFPQCKPAIMAIAKEYEKSRYGAQPGTAQTIARLLKELKL